MPTVHLEVYVHMKIEIPPKIITEAVTVVIYAMTCTRGLCVVLKRLRMLGLHAPPHPHPHLPTCTCTYTHVHVPADPLTQRSLTGCFWMCHVAVILNKHTLHFDTVSV